MMTITTPSHGNTFYCRHPEWMPLEGIAQTWAAFGAEASSPAAFQATGTAFLALAFEATALRHYASSARRSSQQGDAPTLADTQGSEHAMTDLHEAQQQWQSVLLWLDTLAREAPPAGEAPSPSSIQQFISLVHAQQQRILSLLLRVQQEYLDGQQEPIRVSLGYLPAPEGRGGAT
ncbi:MAG TPA: hypothetical protein VIY29_28075 [Ktedonobacteraceae bacterium]